MSEATALAVVVSVLLISSAAVAVVWLRLQAAAAVRQESRDERDAGIVAQLRHEVAANTKAWARVESEWTAFKINNRR